MHFIKRAYIRAVETVSSPSFKCGFRVYTTVTPSPSSTLLPPLSTLYYISSLALTSLVKIAIIFHPLIAHSIQQIGRGSASALGGRAAFRSDFLITPLPRLQAAQVVKATTYWLMIGTLDSDWQGCHDNPTTTARRPIEKRNKIFQCYTHAWILGGDIMSLVSLGDRY